MVEGISEIKGPRQVNKGHLAMPADFDGNRYVGNWAKQGSIANKAKQPETLGGSNLRADGWQTWKDTRGHVCKRSLSSGAYILLFRPKILQVAIQKIYGNESRSRMLQEANGETVGGQAVEDFGVLTEAALSSIPGLGREEREPLNVPFNQVQAPRAVSARASSRTK